MRLRLRVLSIAFGFLFFLFAASALAQPMGRSQQALVSEDLVSVSDQESLGLVGIDTRCSGTLIRNDWVLTAAHCVENDRGEERPLAENGVRSSWANIRDAIAVFRFRPWDIALIQLKQPFSVNGSTYSLVRSLDPVGVYATDIGKNILVFGRGINRLAYEEDGVLHPTADDGKYRKIVSSVASVRHAVYTLNTTAIAYGDSGGSTMRGNREIIGVHSFAYCPVQGTCRSMMLRGLVDPVDVSVHPFRDRIAQIINERRIPSAPRMQVTRGPAYTVYRNPTARAENGADLRLDFCYLPGRSCGQNAADFYCRNQDPTRPLASRFRVADDVGPTAIFVTNEICRSSDCDGFSEIRCSAPADLRPRPSDTYQLPPVLVPDVRPRPSDTYRLPPVLIPDD